MTSISNEPDSRDLRYLQFVQYRMKGVQDSEIADSLMKGSTRELYDRLYRDGYPICPRCGTEVEENRRHPERHCPDPKTPKRSLGDEPVDLPPVADASGVFTGGVERLERALEELPYVRQWLQHKRFITEAEYPSKSGRFGWAYRRTDFEKEFGPVFGVGAWRGACARHGYDPQTTEEFTVPFDQTAEGGSQWYPHDTITALIAVAVLTGDPESAVDSLVYRLHTDPDDVDREECRKAAAELVGAARSLAALVRGNRGAARKGRRSRSFSPEHHRAAKDIKDNEGMFSSEEIQEALGFTDEQMARLRGWRLP